MSVARERDECLHDMASMVQVLDVGMLALGKAKTAREVASVVADCTEATTRLRALFLRLAALYRADGIP